MIHNEKGNWTFLAAQDKETQWDHEAAGKKERKPLLKAYQNIVTRVEQQPFILQQIRQAPKNRLSVAADAGILGLNLFSFWVKKP